MKAQAIALLLVLCISQITASVTIAKDTQEVQVFTQSNTADHKTYGLFFTDQENGLLNAVSELFAGDEEENLQNLLVDSEGLELIEINVN